jgi:hypothetical protein
VTRRADTKRALESEPGLFDRILARLVDPEWNEASELTEWKSPRAWQVLRDMGYAWGAFVLWVTDPEEPERAAQLEKVLRVRAMMLAEETIEIADEATPETVGVAKLRSTNRHWYAESFDRNRFSRQVKPESGKTTVNLIAVLAGMDGGAVVSTQVIEHTEVPVLTVPARPVYEEL